MSGFHLDAGKYAAFLWPAYGISVLVLGGIVLETLAAAHRWRKRAEGRAESSDKPRDGT